MEPARIVLHLPKPVLSGEEPLRWLYERLRDGWTARGGVVDLVPHDRVFLLPEILEDEDFHIVDHGALRHPRILNTGVAYLYPFWNLDPWGIRALSSIGEMKFRRSDVDGAAANEFFRHMIKRWVKPRRSRNAQPEAREKLPENAIAVFLQAENERAIDETCHMGRDEMVAALLARDDPRPIVIKPHPHDRSSETDDWLTRIAADDPRVTVTAANMHDILAAADVTVTINSAVGIESMLHRVPVVLCGRADFHHIAVTVPEPARLDAAIAHATGRRWPYPRFLYWYFRMNCLDAGSKTLVDDVLARIAATGFDTQRFGLSGVNTPERAT